jgi:elongation factor Ts
MAAAAVEVNSETDFVARNEIFQKAGWRDRRSGDRRADCRGAERGADVNGKSGGRHHDRSDRQIGENMSVRRAATLSVDPGVSQLMCTTRLATAWARSACWSR